MRWILRILGAVIVGVILVVAFVSLLPAERIAQVVTTRLAESTGREVSINGAVRPTLWPNLTVVAEGFELANPDWASGAPMVSADVARFEMTWGALFSGEIQMETLDLEGAEVTLVRAEDGRMSWEGGPGLTALRVALGQARLSDTDVRFIDRMGDRRLVLRRVTAVIGFPEAGGAASIAGTGVLGTTRLEGSVTAAGIAQMIDGVAQPLRADLEWTGGAARFDGRAALGGTLEGRLTLEAQDPLPLARDLGIAIPTFPDGFGGNSIAVEGDVTLGADGALFLRDGVVQLDETALDVALDLVPGDDRPLVRGTMTGGSVVVPMENALTDDGAWSDAPVDLSPLFTTDADITVRADRLQLGGADLGDVDLRATLERGRLVFDIARVRAFGGQVAGQFVINGRGSGSTGGELIFAGVDLAQVPGLEGAGGQGSLGFEFLGVGRDLRTVIDGLEGEGEVTLGAGRLPGPVLEALGGVEFDRITTEFRVRQGILLSDDLRIFAPWGTAAGDGRIDMGERVVEYAVQADGAPPLLVSGPFGALEVTVAPEQIPDTEAALVAREAATVSALEQAASEATDE